MHRHVLAGQLPEPIARQASLRRPTLRGLRGGHALQEVGELRSDDWQTPRHHELGDVMRMGPREATVGEGRLVPWRTAGQQDEQADASREDIDRRRLVTVDLCPSTAVRLRARGEEHLAEVRLVHPGRHDGARCGACRYQGVNEVGARDVALRRTVEVLANRPKVPQRSAANAPALHSHAEVHEPQAPILEQYILQRDITVANVVAVEIVNGLQHLPCVALGPAMLQWALLRHLLEQLAPVSELGHQPDVAAILEDAAHAQDEHGQVRLGR
mmetsp:Transcript_99138/g.286063  ORF Transcript_99138/g.286063 Transcript_99138/m.286063 type:complete len:271 (-) Transcript_99138:480-1292(-)